MAVKNRLKVILAEKNISQNELAEKISINRSTLSNIINGKQNSTLETALDLAEILKLHVDDIFYKEKSFDEIAFDDFKELINQMKSIYNLTKDNEILNSTNVASILMGMKNAFIEKYEKGIFLDCLEKYLEKEDLDSLIHIVLSTV
jgi:putative transcriptional regulator